MKITSIRKITQLFFWGFALTIISCGGGDPTSGDQLEEEPRSGDVIYKKFCSSCHGGEGNAQIAGATNLRISVLSIEDRIEVIKKGRNRMMPYESMLSAKEIEAVAEYTKSLIK